MKAMILAAGLLLVTPGLITDALGFFLLVPQGRAAVRRTIAARLEQRKEILLEVDVLAGDRGGLDGQRDALFATAGAESLQHALITVARGKGALRGRPDALGPWFLTSERAVAGPETSIVAVRFHGRSRSVRYEGTRRSKSSQDVSGLQGQGKSTTSETRVSI